METREEYLNHAASIIKYNLFEPIGKTVPNNIRYSTSFPSRKAIGAKNMTIGQCWSSKASTDKHYEIFISPMIDDLKTVIATLIHEIVHAVDDLQSGHGKGFRDIATKVGLEGKMTATTLSHEMWKTLIPLLAPLGVYPHSRLKADDNPIKKQSTRNIKLMCNPCSYGPLRCSRKVIEEALPICPYCRQKLEVS